MTKDVQARWQEIENILDRAKNRANETAEAKERRLKESDAWLESIKASFTDAEKMAHDAIRSSLWAMYPTEETMNSPAEQDAVSDQSAALLIERLRELDICLELRGIHGP